MLTPREYQILRVIVNEYMNSAQPVGSRLLWTRYGLGVSPATIRNVMGALTEAGFLMQPHTSAGRIPTEQAYRLLFDAKNIPALNEEERGEVMESVKRSEVMPVRLRNLIKTIAGRTETTGIQSDEFDTHFYHLGNLFSHPEYHNRLAGELSIALDRASEWLPQVARKPGEITLRIIDGGDPFGVRGLVIIAVKATEEEYQGHAALLGPTRLPYRKIVSYLSEGMKQLGTPA